MASYCCKMIAAPFQALSKCCTVSADFLCTSNRPTCFFLGFSLLMQTLPSIAAVVIGITSLLKTGCYATHKKKLEIFLLVDAALGFLFIYFAIRVQQVFSEPYVVGDTTGESCCCHPDVYQRVAKFVWKDFHFFIFMVLYIFAFVWNILGVGWANSVRDDLFTWTRKLDRRCYAGAVHMARAEVTIMFIYLFLSPFAFLLAACIESCRYRDRVGRQHYTNPPTAPHSPYPSPPPGMYNPPSPHFYPPSPSYPPPGMYNMPPPPPMHHQQQQPPPQFPPLTAGAMHQAAASAMITAASAMQSMAEALHLRPSPAPEAGPSHTPAVPPVATAPQQAPPMYSPQPAVGVPVNMYPNVPPKGA